MTKKLFLLPIGVVFAMSANAQTGKGGVGINTDEPKATLDVVASPDNNSLIDGIIAPRLTGDKLAGKDDLYDEDQKGAMVYVTEVPTSTTEKTENVDAAGYYYFDGAKWVKFAHGLKSPWNIAGTDKTATENTQNIYQSGRVGIQTREPQAQLHIHHVRTNEEPEEKQLYDGFYTAYGRTEINQQNITTDKSYRAANFGLYFTEKNNSTYTGHTVGLRTGIEYLGSSNTANVSSLFNFTRFAGNTKSNGAFVYGLNNASQFTGNAELNGSYASFFNSLDWQTRTNATGAGELYLNKYFLTLKGQASSEGSTGNINKIYLNYYNFGINNVQQINEFYGNYIMRSFNNINAKKKYAYYNAAETLPIYTSGAFRGGKLATTESTDVTTMGVQSFAYGENNAVSANNAAAIGENLRSSSFAEVVIGRYNKITTGNATTSVEADPVFQVGIGTKESDRKNAMTIYKSGKIQLADLPTFATEAEADAALPSGALYKIGGSRAVYQRP